MPLGYLKSELLFKVDFHGARDHAQLTDYKVFVNPSISEVLCTTIVEVNIAYSCLRNIHAKKLIALTIFHQGTCDGEMGYLPKASIKRVFRAIPELFAL